VQLVYFGYRQVNMNNSVICHEAGCQLGTSSVFVNAARLADPCRRFQYRQPIKKAQRQPIPSRHIANRRGARTSGEEHSKPGEPT
jgi:hypothetical protein